ncbi:glycoside hydrolase [Phytophthora cinnamomi]|uniref:glycoside hydrolase n=1 Tax=Phytophthora cinnamomi TaxID=4785 RepID=UPI00355AC7FD|nr:glycoside hydrolase [Phytophthora cinnamomi]
MNFQSGVQVFIPAALNRPTHTLYSICMLVQPTNQEWTVNRRYSQFLQLRKDIQHKLGTRGVSCANCASFNRAIGKFRFPGKSLLRTNSVVRHRVSALQDFLKLLVGRTYNDLPKCGICGDEIKDMMRPFLIRGAQPMNGSILPKINKSLSLESYAVVDQPVMPVPEPVPPISPSLVGKELFSASKSSSKPIFTHSQISGGKSIFARSKAMMSTRSDDASTQPNESEDPIMDYSDSDDDGYGKKYDDQRCYDEGVPLEEAMKQVVVPKGARLTCEEVVVRLTSMWAAYDLDEALSSLPPERLSQQATFSVDDKEYAF